MRIERRPFHAVELQMGPMIDVIFLLLVFFLVQPRPDPEAELGVSLPGTVVQAEAVPLPDEQRIEIRAGGQVILNDLPLGAPGDRELPDLVRVLRRFKAACEADRSPALVTLLPEDSVPHQRLTDVLNACARAGITGVSFGAPDDDGS